MSVRTIIFSKDRPLQLDACLMSMFGQRSDLADDVCVLYRTTSYSYERAYEVLIRRYADAAVKFVAEPGTNFPEYLRPLVAGSDLFKLGYPDGVLFVVDDTMFVRPFDLGSVMGTLRAWPEVLGVSLRLGHNTQHCYPTDSPQAVPPMHRVTNLSLLWSFDWTDAEHARGDFGYPLELSSSLYRTEDVLPIIERGGYAHPNSLEERMHEAREGFRSSRPSLLCFAKSRAFSVPWNRVQYTHESRTSGRQTVSPEWLMQAFQAGMEIDVNSYEDYENGACHQDVRLFLAERGE